MNASLDTDVIVIGAGPIGLEMAAALKINGFDYRLIEAGNIGSTIHWYAIGTPIFSSPERLEIAGVPFRLFPNTRSTREEYLNYLRSVATLYKLRIDTFRRVVGIECRADGTFECAIARSDHGVGGPREHERPDADWPIERTLTCRRLVLAIGDMHRPRELGIPGERLPFVSHYFGDPHLSYGQRVVIVGGKNSAAEAAIRLQRLDARVTLIHRAADFDETRVKPWLLPEVRLLVKENKMAFLPRTKVVEIVPGAVRLENLDDGSRSEEMCDQVLLLTGYRQDPSLFERLGLELAGEGRAPVFNPATMETSQKNVYVAGTCTAGTQFGGVTTFIETSHVHVKRIIESFGGRFFDSEAKVRAIDDREQ